MESPWRCWSDGRIGWGKMYIMRSDRSNLTTLRLPSESPSVPTLSSPRFAESAQWYQGELNPDPIDHGDSFTMRKGVPGIGKRRGEMRLIGNRSRIEDGSGALGRLEGCGRSRERWGTAKLRGHGEAITDILMQTNLELHIPFALFNKIDTAPRLSAEPR